MHSSFNSLLLRGRRFATSKDILPGLLVVWILLLAGNLLRALRFPHPYAKGHWLFHYGYGFVKRGLPGALFRPWVAEKTALEINTILDAVGLIVLLVTFAMCVLVSRRVLARTQMSPAWWMAALGTTVFMLSPFVVSEANLCGYFDHLLMIATLIGVACIRRGYVVTAGLLGATSMLSHEMFLLFGLPVWCWALWLECTDRVVNTPERPTPMALVRRYGPLWLMLLVPSLALAAFLSWGESAGVFKPAGEEVFAYANALGVIPEGWLQISAHPLRVTVSENMGNQLPQFFSWLVSRHAWTVIHPTTVCFLFLALWMLVERRYAKGLRFFVEASLLTLVIVAPILIAAIGWDWQRFMMMPPFHGWMALLITLESGSMREEGDDGARRVSRLRAGAPWVAGGLLCVVAMTSSLKGEVFFTAPGNGPDRAFHIRGWNPYRCDRPLFPNSNFASGTFENWTVKGEAFFGQPLSTDLPAARGAPASPRGPWVGSYEGGTKPPPRRKGGGRRTKSSGAPREPSDRYKGRLRSVPFVVEGDTVVFRVGGGADRKHTYVRLLVDGEEAFRVTGRNEERLTTERWDVTRHRGRDAVIEIVDDARRGWGHINAEGFCYED